MAKEHLPRGVSVVQRSRRGIPVKLYQVRVTWKGKRELVGRFESLTDARHAQILAQADVVRGTFVPPSEIRAARKAEDAAERLARFTKVTVEALSRDWIAHLRRLDRKESTLYTYQKRIDGQILPHFGTVPVDAVTPQAVEDWFYELDRKQGNGVSRGAYMMLAGMFTYAAGKARGQRSDFKPLIEASPCRIDGATKHKPVRPTGAAEKIITDEQLTALAAAMPPAQRVAVLLGGWQALRIGEVLGLQRGDVTGDWLKIARQLQSRGQGLRLDTPKTSAGVREIPLFPVVVEALLEHLRDHVGEADDAPLFPRSERGSVYLHPNVLRRHFKTAVEDTEGIPGTFVFHGLRHTALTRLAQRNATLAELKMFAGHDDDKTVQRYQHAPKQRLAALVKEEAQ